MILNPTTVSLGYPLHVLFPLLFISFLFHLLLLLLNIISMTMTFTNVITTTLIIYLSTISRPLYDPDNPVVQKNHHSLPHHFPLLTYIVEIIVFSPLGGKSDWSSLGLEKIKFTSLLTYTPLLTSAAPTHQAATCASHCRRNHWPPFYPQPASAGSCGNPELIYGPNGLVPSDSDALQNVTHE